MPIRTFEARYKHRYRSITALLAKMGEQNEDAVQLRTAFNGHLEICKAGIIQCYM